MKAMLKAAVLALTLGVANMAMAADWTNFVMRGGGMVFDSEDKMWYSSGLLHGDVGRMIQIRNMAKKGDYRLAELPYRNDMLPMKPLDKASCAYLNPYAKRKVCNAREGYTVPLKGAKVWGYAVESYNNLVANEGDAWCGMGEYLVFAPMTNKQYRQLKKRFDSITGSYWQKQKDAYFGANLNRYKNRAILSLCIVIG